MRIVKRHDILSASILLDDVEKFKKLIPIFVIGIEKNPASLGKMLSDSSRGFNKANGSGLPAEEVRKYLVLLKNIALGNFRYGAGQDTFSLTIGDRELQINPAPKTDFMSVDHWKEAFDACVVLRDMDGLKFLSQVDEKVFINSNNGASSFDLAYYRFMAHFFNGGQHTGALLVAVMEEANKPQASKVRQAFVDLVRYPELRLLQEFVEGNAQAFNDQLFDALQKHKQYYGTNENAMATPGWTSFPLLAACAIAVDNKHFPIEVQSEYIPQWLISGVLA